MASYDNFIRFIMRIYHSVIFIEWFKSHLDEKPINLFNSFLSYTPLFFKSDSVFNHFSVRVMINSATYSAYTLALNTTAAIL